MHGKEAVNEENINSIIKSIKERLDRIKERLNNLERYHTMF